jgi:hypothetical protein
MSQKIFPTINSNFAKNKQPCFTTIVDVYIFPISNMCSLAPGDKIARKLADIPAQT